MKFGLILNQAGASRVAPEVQRSGNALDWVLPVTSNNAVDAMRNVGITIISSHNNAPMCDGIIVEGNVEGLDEALYASQNRPVLIVGKVFFSPKRLEAIIKSAKSNGTAIFYPMRMPRRSRAGARQVKLIESSGSGPVARDWDSLFLQAGEYSHKVTNCLSHSSAGGLQYSLHGVSDEGCIWSIESSGGAKESRIEFGDGASEVLKPEETACGECITEFCTYLQHGWPARLRRLEDALTVSHWIDRLKRQASAKDTRTRTLRDPSLIARAAFSSAVHDDETQTTQIVGANDVAISYVVDALAVLLRKDPDRLQVVYSENSAAIRIDESDCIISVPLKSPPANKAREVKVSFGTDVARNASGVHFRATAVFQCNVNPVVSSENALSLSNANKRSAKPSAKNYLLAFNYSSLALANAKKRATRIAPEMDCHRQIRQILSAHGPWTGATLLDAGCGAGHLYYSIQGLGIAYYGIDCIEALVRLGDESIERSARAPFRIETRLLETIRDDEFFDIVVATNFLYWQPDWCYPLELLARTAKKALVLRDPFGPRHVRRWAADILLDSGEQRLNCYFNILPLPEVTDLLERLDFTVEVLPDERIQQRFAGEPECVGAIDFPYQMIFAKRKNPL